MTLSPLTWKGRLPGVAMLPIATTNDDNPLRMDVAGFVGFAERGPLDTPILVEDMGQYRAIFGGDVFLARSKGLPIYAQLPRAVQAFFDNGGRRCYVVRVAGQSAQVNRLPIPGLVAWKPGTELRSVVCPAASEGRWSDDLQTATQVHRQPLVIEHGQEKTACTFSLVGPVDKQALSVTVAARTQKPTTLQKDDLLLLRFNDPGRTFVHTRVSLAIQDGASSGEYSATRSIKVNIQGDTSGTVAFTSRHVLPDRATLASVEYRAPNDSGDEWSGSLRLSSVRDIIQPTDAEPTYQLKISKSYEAEFSTLGEMILLRLTYEKPPDQGDPAISTEVYMLACRMRKQPTYLELTSSTLEITGARGIVVDYLTPQGWSEARPRKLVPLSSLRYLPSADGLPLQISVQGLDTQLVAGDVLRITPIASNRLPGNRSYLMQVANVDLEFQAVNQPAMVIHSAALWEQVAPKDLVAQGVAAELNDVSLLTFDLLIREGSDYTERWRDLRFNTHDRLVTKSLRANYWESVFFQPLDRDQFFGVASNLIQRSVRLRAPDLPRNSNEADWLFLPLGMNENIPVVPDFMSRLQNEIGANDGLSDFNPATLFLDDRFLGTDPLTGHAAALSVGDVATLANELIYARGLEKRPVKLHSLYAVDQVSIIAIPDLGHRPWNGCAPVEEPPITPDTPVDHSEFSRCESGSVPKKLSVSELLHLGESSTRAHPEVDIFQGLNALPDVELNWQPCQNIRDAVLVHRAMINMAAARADLLAVLGVPFGYSYLDAIDWHQQVTEVMPRAVPKALSKALFGANAKASASSSNAVAPSPTPPFFGGHDDNAAYSYAAAFFGWLNVREENTPELRTVRTVAPDGTVCGMIAARTLARGPGVAPANIPLLNVVGLEPSSNDAQWEELFNHQINVLLTRPDRFATMSAYTLSDDSQLLQISVRRLLIFLRKLVLHEGYRFAFESNTERFRRSVQIRFEHIFNQLLRRGSLAAFVVDTGSSLNTFESVDRGRFIISIQVALTYPVEFITITLLRTGDNLLEVAVR